MTVRRVLPRRAGPNPALTHAAFAWQGDVLFTLFAEEGGTSGPTGTRRVIDKSCVDAACARIVGAYGFGNADAHDGAPAATPLIRCFIERDGSVTRA